MRAAIKITTMLCLSCLSLCLPLTAAPIDGEVAAVWWASDVDSKTETESFSTDTGAPGLRAELRMLERYGVLAAQYQATADGAGIDYTNVDFVWRALAPTEDNFVALGLGWQMMDVQGFANNTSGVRVSVEGRIELPANFYAYGQGSYLPSLQNAEAADPTLGEFRDLDAHEYEVGVAWEATPLIRVHAGYRANNLSFTQNRITPAGGSGPSLTPVPGGGSQIVDLAPGLPGTDCEDCSPNALVTNNGETESAGFFLGVGFKF